MSKKIKVMHVCDKFGVSGSSIHGVSRLFAWWFPRFDLDQFEVSLVGLRRADQATENLRSLGLQVESLNKNKFDFTTYFALKKAIKEFGAQVVHLHGYGATNFGIPSARALGAKVVLHEHFVDPNLPFYQYPFDRALCPLIDRGVSNCIAVKDFMVEKRCCDPNNIDVIYNGVAIEDFVRSDDSVRQQIRQRWGIPQDALLLASIGRLDEQKGNKYLIQAAAKLIKEIPNTYFLIVGDGPLMDDLKKQSEDQGTSHNIIFTGYLDEIPQVQSAIDVQVFPSLWEGTTLTIFEAMAIGVPVVSTDADGLAEIVKDGENALVVKPGDAEALFQAMRKICQDDNLRQQLAKASYAGRTQYDIQNTVNQLQDLYRELIT